MLYVFKDELNKANHITNPTIIIEFNPKLNR